MDLGSLQRWLLRGRPCPGDWLEYAHKVSEYPELKQQMAEKYSELLCPGQHLPGRILWDAELVEKEQHQKQPMPPPSREKDAKGGRHGPSSSLQRAARARVGGPRKNPNRPNAGLTGGDGPHIPKTLRPGARGPAQVEDQGLSSLRIGRDGLPRTSRGLGFQKSAVPGMLSRPVRVDDEEGLMGLKREEPAGMLSGRFQTTRRMVW